MLTTSGIVWLTQSAKYYGILFVIGEYSPVYFSQAPVRATTSYLQDSFHKFGVLRNASGFTADVPKMPKHVCGQ